MGRDVRRVCLAGVQGRALKGWHRQAVLRGGSDLVAGYQGGKKSETLSLVNDERADKKGKSFLQFL